MIILIHPSGNYETAILINGQLVYSPIWTKQVKIIHEIKIENV